MNISRAFERGIVLTVGAATLASMTLNSCSKQQDNKLIHECADSIDTNKPNLPVFSKDSIYYLGLDGKVNSAVNSKEVSAVYNAIAKMSTKECPDISEIEDFYLEIQKNIQADAKDDKNMWAQPRIERNVYKARLSDYFDKLYKMFTKSESDKGSIITVKEYTKMMDAFSNIEPCGKNAQ